MLGVPGSPTLYRPLSLGATSVYLYSAHAGAFNTQGATTQDVHISVEVLASESVGRGAATQPPFIPGGSSGAPFGVNPTPSRGRRSFWNLGKVGLRGRRAGSTPSPPRVKGNLGHSQNKRTPTGDNPARRGQGPGASLCPAMAYRVGAFVFQETEGHGAQG